MIFPSVLYIGGAEREGGSKQDQQNFNDGGKPQCYSGKKRQSLHASIRVLKSLDSGQNTAQNHARNNHDDEEEIMGTADFEIAACL